MKDKKISWWKSLLNYLSTFPETASNNSTKLLALLISATTGGFLAGVIIPFVLIYDVLINGYVKTDLSDLGIFLLCIGAYVFGSGVNVTVPKILGKKEDKEKEEEEV